MDSRRRKQLIEGWGGCFNERGQRAIESLPRAERDALMRSLFDPKTGLKLNLGRTPIGASDYAVDLYSLDETPGDYAMRDFSVARDRKLLIPYLKAALAIRPDLRLWAVPWSPPSWMKDNGSLVAGRIKDDSKTLDALALYFARYVQALPGGGHPDRHGHAPERAEHLQQLHLLPVDGNAARPVHRRTATIGPSPRSSTGSRRSGSRRVRAPT